MVAAVYTLILTPNRSKKVWPPRKSPQNDGYVYIINTLYMSVILQPVKISEEKNKKTTNITYEKDKKR